MMKTAGDRTDRAAWGFVLAVFIGTLTFGGVWLWWLWHPAQGYDLSSNGNIVHRVAGNMGTWSWFKALSVGGCALLAAAALGLGLRRPWGYALALACSVALIAIATEVRMVAVFLEPRGYVHRSAYVRAATAFWWPLAMAHVLTAWLALRALARGGSAARSDDAGAVSAVRPHASRATRLALALLALQCALPALLPSRSSAPIPPASAAVIVAAALVGVAALVAAAWPRRGCVRAVWTTAVVALVGVIPVIAYVFHSKRHYRGIHQSIDVEFISLLGILAAPPVLAILALAWRASSVRRREAAEAAAAEGSPPM